ncbi:MAG: hypothetical protein ACTSYI_14385, partial [Promethearchaeota archaeon]
TVYQDVEGLDLGNHFYMLIANSTSMIQKNETIEVIVMTQEEYDAYFEEHPADPDDDVDDGVGDGVDDGDDSGSTSGIAGYNWWLVGSICIVGLIVLRKRKAVFQSQYNSKI